MTMKPRQVIHRQTKIFGASETTFTKSIGANLTDSEAGYLLRFFKYVAVEMLFLNSSNTKKTVTGTFRLLSMSYLPVDSHSTSSPYVSASGTIINRDISNESVFSTEWEEANGISLRFETDLGETIAEGDKAVINIIGIR